MDFSKFDEQVDIEGLKHDVKEAEENGGSVTFEEVPFGTYEVKVDKLELKESKKGSPMLSVWFKILEGEHKNGLIFMNQVVNEGFQIHIANEMLRALADGEKDVEFNGYAKYNNLIMDIFEIVGDKFGYILEYGQNKKGYNTFEIKEVFDL